MALYAVLADIHGNYPALQAVKKDAQKIARYEGNGNVTFICLGDVVNYGPQPNKCMAWVRKHVAIAIQGNHDRVAATPLREPPQSIDIRYWPITLWTRRVLDDRHKDAARMWRPRQDAPDGLKDFTLLHSSLVWEDGYINHERAAQSNIERMRTHYGIFGHTHIQGCFVEDVESVATFLACPEDVEPQAVGWQPIPVGVWKPLPGKWQRALFNPGSVGQPRRPALLMGSTVAHDYRAAYMLLRLNGHGNGDFQFRRVNYDVEKTIRLLRNEVRWPEEAEETQGKAEGGSIYKDATTAPSPASWDPMAQELSKTLAEINERLPWLVEEVLVPLLQ